MNKGHKLWEGLATQKLPLAWRGVVINEKDILDLLTQQNKKGKRDVTFLRALPGWQHGNEGRKLWEELAAKNPPLV